MGRSLALLAFALAGCGGAGAAANQVAADNRADGAREKLLPCSVQAHGFGGVLREAPEPAECDDSVDPQTVGLDALIRIAPDSHPAFYYVLAARLFEADRKDEAAFWFYAGQLRYRTRLACHADLRRDIEPALFGSLQETVGRRINEYVAGSTSGWVATMERALAWDEATHNGFEPKAPCRAQIADQRRGLGELIAHVRQNEAQIRRERTANGLPNR